MVHALGRQPIGVNQPPSGGSNYPFVAPSDDIKYLLGDFYLSYEDDLCALVTPFHVAWLHGFGTNPVAAPSGFPVPVHSHDILVVDDDGTTVFDSTEAVEFLTSEWPVTNPRLLIIEWRTENQVLRLTQHTAWSQEDIDDGQDKVYDDYIVPDNGVLSGDVYERLPLRVRSVRVGLQRITNAKLILQSGFNVSVTQVPEEEDLAAELLEDLADLVGEAAPAVVPGTRKTTQVAISAVPGSGLGVVPGCEDIEPVVRRVGGAIADAGGNLNIDAEGCIRIQRPLGLVGVEPREFRYLNFDLTPEQARSAFEIQNDCGPCCDCAFYVRTYKGLKRQWNFWQGLAQQGEEARDTFILNRDRWLREKQCREENPLKLILLPEPDCKVAGGALHCNTFQCCAVPLVMRFTFKAFKNGVEYDPEEPTCLEVEVSGSPQGLGSEDAVWAGSWPVYEVWFDYADPHDTSRVSFRFCVDGCGTNNNIQMFVSTHYPDMETTPEGIECSPPVKAVPAEIEAMWAASELGPPPYTTRALDQTKILPLNNQSGFCQSCPCEPEEGSQ